MNGTLQNLAGQGSLPDSVVIWSPPFVDDKICFLTEAPEPSTLLYRQHMSTRAPANATTAANSSDPRYRPREALFAPASVCNFVKFGLLLLLA
ncbi:hypothetical protein CC2G_002786 [Coprinopsis cinerea AmutBmut pab1-1]|nr:hypothetical protein CC2G_002786 [Coprinopsis cinerea AmutBmut pab1-1]